jgi:hypothetical protein
MKVHIKSLTRTVRWVQRPRFVGLTLCDSPVLTAIEMKTEQTAYVDAILVERHCCA